MKPRIVVLTGDSKGEIFPLFAGQSSIGRKECDLNLPDACASRRHCTIAFESGEYVIRDSGSRYGTVVNGDDIRSKTTTLHHGDRVVLGDTQLAFLTEEEQPAEEPDVYFSDSIPLSDNCTPVSPGRTLDALIDCNAVLRNAQDVTAIREELVSFIFKATPADRVAVILVGENGKDFEFVSGQDRRTPARSVGINLDVVEGVLRDGQPWSAIEVPAEPEKRIVICAAIEGRTRRLGVVYADASSRTAQFEMDHVEMLMVAATLAGTRLEHVQEVERLQTRKVHHDFIGDSPALMKVIGFIAIAGPTSASVLIQGESGTGKELMARALHRTSPRSNRPFVALNCAAIPENLLESELFGYEKGAFTGAQSRKIGKFEQASGGTLFLDEVGDLGITMQAKLLRVLQQREVERVGGTGDPIPVDIRVIAATNKNLVEAISKGEFRQDLWFRLKVLSITMPALRERPQDIVPLARHFMGEYARQHSKPARAISPVAEWALLTYLWPGNIRELQNVIEQGVILCNNETLLPEHLPIEISGEAALPYGSELPGYDEILEATQRLVVSNALRKANGDYKVAAALLRLHPNSIHRLANALGLAHLLQKPGQSRETGSS